MEFYHEKIVNQVNALKTRSYYIPFTDENFSPDKEKSKEVVVLKKWKFAFFPEFTEEVFGENPTETFSVPFNWQLKGFDYNQYTNFFYPIPFDPPKVDKENPCGLYVTDYVVAEEGRKHYIVFDGVDSCLYLLVNGKFVGYSTVSHSQAEFDITPFVAAGKNEIRAVVLKWCCGTYFEDQDKLRMSGIFRDVYVISRPKDHIADYKITTDTDLKMGTISVVCDRPATVKLYDGERLIDEKKGEKTEFLIENVKLWTAETPFLYRLVLQYNGEYIEEKIGVRKISIENSVLKINGAPVKLKGVNRHSMTTDGFAESVDLMKKDLGLFRKYNVNAVRTSHYPPHPLFAKLCDEYGIYVLEEADIETHGLETIHYYGDPRHFDDFANNPLYKDVYLLRQERMYERDKNRTSVIMWSLGNEAGWGENFKAASEYLHAADSRPVHYEGNTTRMLPETEWRDPEYTDVASMMYASVETCRKKISAGIGKPFMLCEYTHAMGNSCGDAKEYWDYIYGEKTFLGAFVWEWCCHTVKTDDGRFLFGGDFNEKEPCSRYDGKFCVDGLVDTDRRIHPSLYEIGQIYAPVDVEQTAEGFRVINRYDFIPLDKISLKCRYEINGKTEKTEEYSLLGIKPKESREFKINFKKSGYSAIIFEFFSESEKVATRQIVLSGDYPVKEKTGEADVKREKRTFVARGKGYKATVGKDGMIESVKLGGGDEEIMVAPMNFSLYREPIDNDLPYLEEWQRLRLAFVRSHADEITCDGNKVFVKGKIVADIVEPLYDFELRYEFCDDAIGVSMTAKKREWVTNPARFGLKFTLPEKFDECEYFGRGDVENYPDRKFGLAVSHYKNKVSEMNFMYLKPQDCGERCDCRKVSLCSQDKAFSVVSGKDFCFQATPYDIGDYRKHDYMMEKNTGKTMLFLDAKTTGVGSAACGAPLAERYEVRDDEIKMSFDIVLA